MKHIFLFIFILSFSTASFAQKKKKQIVVEQSAPTEVTYDLSASVGTYNSASYSEATLGLNWWLQDWMNWRNAVFTRFGSSVQSVSGFDTSLRFAASAVTDGGSFGVDAFAGPGLRFASANSNAVFGEAGLIFRLGGLHIGGGLKSLYYSSDRTDSVTGLSLPKNDTQFFIILAGGGAF